MSERFEGLTRAMAASTSRRNMLKVFGGAAIGAVAATVLRPLRSYGTGGTVPCTAGLGKCGSACCPAGEACVDRVRGVCGCPAGRTQCGSHCCPAGTACRNGQCGCAAGSELCGSTCCSGTCSDKESGCCCDAGTTPCGRACCSSGVACIDKSRGLCGCPAGYKSCGSASSRTCCPSGKACRDASCVSPSTLGTTVKTCCGPGSCCGLCCPGEDDSCNPNGCYCDQFCLINGDCCGDFQNTC